MPKAKEPKEPTEADKNAAKAAREAIVEAAAAQRQSRADAFKALGDPIRLAVCEYLAFCSPSDPQTAGAVCRAVTGDKKITAKVSHHLKELRRAGLIVMHKKGKNVLCGLDSNGANALSAYLSAWSDGTDAVFTNNFMEGNPTDDDTLLALDDAA